MNARAKILAAGIHTIAANEYHADPAPEPSLSNSIIKTLLQSTPRHAWLNHPRLNPQFEPSEGSDIFDIGSAAHAMLLEGEDTAVVVDAKDWRTKAAQEERDAARAAGRLVMLRAQHSAALAMVDAARSFIDSTSLRGILQRGKPEQTLIWQDLGGIYCRARLDWLTDDRSVILDYKTTGVGGPGDFMRRNIAAHGYDTQALFYPRGLTALGHPGARFMFLVQETFSPFMCYLVELAESRVELASHKLARAVPLWRDCLLSNRWPGYSTDVYQADAAVWEIKEEELA